MTIVPGEQEDLRLWQAAYVSRYGSDPIHTWDDREVSELVDAYEQLAKIVRMENGTEG